LSRRASLAHAASAGTASASRQAPAANGPTSIRRTSTPDQAVINVPTIIARTPERSTFEGRRGSAPSRRELTDIGHSITDLRRRWPARDQNRAFVNEGCGLKAPARRTTLD
jgi:hypothetical protein